MVLSSTVTPAAEWKFAQDTVRVKPRLTVNNNEAAIEAVCRGFGITRLLSYQIAPYLASGKLKTVLSKFEPQRLPIHILHREGRYASARVRTFLDLMIARLRSDQALN
ncbi:MAG: LysR substrate-binding domain-containing protein [Burkholderiales bacterium]